MKEDKKLTCIELTEDELNNVVGGVMAPSLYYYGVGRIQDSGIAQALKDKAYKELERMRASNTTYYPDDVEKMLHKRGI